jgi:mRNA-degrading endonuclease toxin of MazEF toxin-antitoxin module
MHKKDFEGWNTLKQNLDNRQNTSVPTIKEREIWWCSIGVNIGDEEDGYNELYNRPVLIVRKFNDRIFWGVAITTKTKADPHYFPIDLKGSKRCVMLSHLRLYDSKRLISHRSKMGKLSPKQFEAVKRALKELL